MKWRFILSGLVFLSFQWSGEKVENDSRQIYIEKYSELAIKEMYLSGIPASIKLAQALYESGNGEGKLAIESNNHFGIKCKNDWNGSTYAKKDDDYNENGELIESCFRAYPDVASSFRDHSEFLRNSPRYLHLFQYGKNYRLWAYGIKNCGYATNKNYAEILIRIIEENQLFKFDVNMILPEPPGSAYKTKIYKEEASNNRAAGSNDTEDWNHFMLSALSGESLH